MSREIMPGQSTLAVAFALFTILSMTAGFVPMSSATSNTFVSEDDSLTGIPTKNTTTSANTSGDNTTDTFENTTENTSETLNDNTKTDTVENTTANATTDIVENTTDSINTTGDTVDDSSDAIQNTNDSVENITSDTVQNTSNIVLNTSTDTPADTATDDVGKRNLTPAGTEKAALSTPRSRNTPTGTSVGYADESNSPMWSVSTVKRTISTIIDTVGGVVAMVVSTISDTFAAVIDGIISWIATDASGDPQDPASNTTGDAQRPWNGAAPNCTAVHQNTSVQQAQVSIPSRRGTTTPNDTAPVRAISGGPAQAPPTNGTGLVNSTSPAVSADTRGLCQLNELFSPPDWVAATTTSGGEVDPDTSTDDATTMADVQNHSSATMQAQLALKRDLQAILNAEPNSQGIFAAGERALKSRQQMVANGHLKPGLQPSLASTKTKLHGARALIQTQPPSDEEPDNLSPAVKLTRRGFKLQGAQLSATDHSTKPTGVTLPATPTPKHATPSAAAFAILEAKNVTPTAEQKTELRELDELSEPTRSELTDVLDAYLGYHLTAQEANPSSNSTNLPNTSASNANAGLERIDVQRLRAAQLRLLTASADLHAALEGRDAPGLAGTSSHEPVNEAIQVGPLSIDLSTHNDTYTKDYALLIDPGGNDTYNNNAGGANGGTNLAAALIDLQGKDSYNGRNGGGTNSGAGFLLDAAGDDTYDAGTKRRDFAGDNYCPAGGCGTNGGAFRGLGFLLDAGTGADSYNASSIGTNGGSGVDDNVFSSEGRMAGFLLDQGGNDTYIAGDWGTNGGAHGDTGNGRDQSVLGFLMDAGFGDDIYTARDKGTNGAGHNGAGFLLDAGGDEVYDAGSFSNGGGHAQAAYPSIPLCCSFRIGKPTGGFLLDSGAGDDTYNAGDRGTNGGGASEGVGFLLDDGGNDTYSARKVGSSEMSAGATNGGGSSGGTGFLFDGGTGNDIYAAVKKGQGEGPCGMTGNCGTNGGAYGTQGTSEIEPRSFNPSAGFILDAGGSDSYITGKKGGNGGGYHAGIGFLWDRKGDDSYTAKFAGVNGGADLGTGVLIDSRGTDFYTERGQTCRDCSDVPKGLVGAQVDAESDNEEGNNSTPNKLLVVDDDLPATGDVACSNETANATYAEIQTAVDNAKPGDTILVCGGTYPGEVNVTTANVTLRASDPGQTVLDGAGTRRFGVLLKAENTTVNGFVATNFTSDDAAAFLSTRPSTTITNTTIRNSDYGIIVTGLYSGSLMGELPVGGDGARATTIRNNTVTDADYGILVYDTGNVNVTSNTVTGVQYGIPVNNVIEVNIHNNTVAGNDVPRSTNQRGISVLSSEEIHLTSNTVTGFKAPTNRIFHHDYAPYGHGYGIEILNPGGTGEDSTHVLRNNTMATNTYNLQLYSPDYTDYIFLDIDSSNTVNGKPVIYRKNATNAVINSDENPGYVACIACLNVTVRDLQFAHNGQGVLLVKSRNATVTNVTVRDTWQGIALHGSPNNAVVTNNTVRESYTAIYIKHTCSSGVNPLGVLFRRDSYDICAPDGPSVVVSNNNVRDTGFLFNTSSGLQYLGWTAWHGGSIMVDGGGVTVRQNTVADAYGAGISMKIGEPYPVTPAEGGCSSGTVTSASRQANQIVDATVSNNSISDAYLGVVSIANDGTTFTGNEITDVRFGIFNIWNCDLTYRKNTVTNATYGMFIHFADQNIRARNNTFKEVRWGLHVLFTWFAGDAPGSHDFGTSNTVNGEQILWLEGATNQVINDNDANYLVCVRCVNVTIRDMTLTDNGAGVVLWDTTDSRIENVSIKDTIHTGIGIIAGRNNVVANSTVIDSQRPIIAQPIDYPTSDDQLETVGSVRLVNNNLTVKNATWPDPAYQHPGPSPRGWDRPQGWTHTGITLFNPTNTTVVGNRVTNMRWGIIQEVFTLQQEAGCLDCTPQGAAQNVEVANNTVIHPSQRKGLARFGNNTAWLLDGIHLYPLGVRVNTEGTKAPTANISVNNNKVIGHGRFSESSIDRPTWGVRIDMDEMPSVTVGGNDIHGYERSVQIDATGNTSSSIAILENRLTGASQASVSISSSTPGGGVEIHRNLLDPAGLGGYGVNFGVAMGGDGHQGGGGEGTSTTTGVVNATCNNWGTASGPSSPNMMRHDNMTGHILTDPETGAKADGTGAAVSEGPEPGISNVHFDPWVPPPSNCAQSGDIPEDDDPHEGMNHHTPTPTPTQTPKSTPTATVTPDDGTSGSGDGGTGSGGTGSGSGGTGSGTGGVSGRSGDSGGSGGEPSQEATPDDVQNTAQTTATAQSQSSDSTSTATPRATPPKPSTDTPTNTPPPTITPTPEVVPGFGVVVSLVGVVLIVGFLVFRRRD